MKKTLFATGAAILAVIGGTAAMAGADDVAGRGRPMADQTRAALIQELDTRFAALDTNRDGTISKDEMAAAGKARRDARFAKLDTDGNGSISRAEFDAPRDKGGEHRGHGERGRNGWHGGHGHHRGGPGMMDADKDGNVTKAEFQARALARFDRADTDHNGTVTVAERQAAWSAMKAHRSPGPRA